MEYELSPFAWPECEGYLTLRSLDDAQDSRVWLVQREADQCFLVMKLACQAETLATIRQGTDGPNDQHTIKVHDTVMTNRGPALLVEYCPGGSLGQMVAARGPLPLGEVITALAPVAQSVARLHSQGLAHGDVSPNNILLSAEGMPKLCDFQEVNLLGENNHRAGTPGFIASEAGESPATAPDAVANGEARDVYALGACLWYLLSAKVPDPPALRAPVTLVFEDLPETVLDLLLDALHPEPTARPSADQFARSLYASGQAEPLNWTESVPAQASHLMATIHPPAPRGRRRAMRPRPERRQRLVPERPEVTQEQARRFEDRHALKPTPGGRRLIAAALLGLFMVVIAGLGVNHWQSQTDANAANGEQAPVDASRTCSIQSDAQLPPCAQSPDAVGAALLKLTHARDRAFNSGDYQALSKLYVPEAKQLGEDARVLQELKDMDLGVTGMRTRLSRIEVVARSFPDTVVLEAHSVLDPYAYRSLSSEEDVHRAQQARAERVRFELRQHTGQWLISRILARETTNGTAANGDPMSGYETGPVED